MNILHPHFEQVGGFSLKDKMFFGEEFSRFQHALGGLRCGMQLRCPDTHGTLLMVSDGWLAMTGYTEEECMENLTHTSFIMPEDVEKFIAQTADQLAEHRRFLLQYRVRRKDDSIFWVQESCTEVVVSGQVLLQSVLLDITEQKSTQANLLISDKRFEVAMQFADITMFEYDVLTKEMFFSEDMAAMYNIPSMLPDGIEAFISLGYLDPTCHEEYRKLYQRMHEGDAFAMAIMHVRDALGNAHDFELSLTNVFDTDGKPLRAIGVRKNITKILQLEKEKEFGQSLAADRMFVAEANITWNKLLYLDEMWAASLGGSTLDPFSSLVENACQKIVHPDDRQAVTYALSREHIVQVFDSGEKRFAFSFRSQSDENAPITWFEGTVNIIKDQTTSDIVIRYYLMDITQQKLLEEKTQEEQNLYEAMLAKSMIAFEINLTDDLVILANAPLSAVGIAANTPYSRMVQLCCSYLIHPDDAAAFAHTYDLQNLSSCFAGGQREVELDFRQITQDENWHWVHCVLHLYQDPNTADIKGYAYLEDIHEEKETQLALIYSSEHDLLTNLYNKITTEKLITEFLRCPAGRAGIHALFMIDVDYFKQVNDNLGHAFGDAVLSQVAAKLTALFRDYDIVGRIGGDEFMILMKSVPDIKFVTTKAQGICQSLRETYSQNGKEYSVSASVGVALFPKDGMNYDELYANSDTALYASKRGGRDQYHLYNLDISQASSSVTAIDRDMGQPKSFKENISEYVFRILYEAPDRMAAVDSVLELIGKHYGVSRAYVFQRNTPTTMSNTFEWCANGIESQKAHLQNLLVSSPLFDYESCFNEKSLFFLPDVEQAQPALRDFLKQQNIYSMLQFAFKENDLVQSFIGFDYCSKIHDSFEKEFSDFRIVSQIVGLFLAETRNLEENRRMRDLALSVVNGLDSYAYVCDPQSYEICFINDSARTLAPAAQVGQRCYAAFWGQEAPCKICPMQSLQAGSSPRFTLEMQNPHLNIWTKTTASWIPWQHGPACLIDCVDITQYKQ